MKSEEIKMEKEFKETAELFKIISDRIIIGFALCELLFDEQGNPTDYRFLKVNPAFGKQSGLEIKNVIGKTVKEIYPDIEQSWIDKYSAVVTNNKPIQSNLLITTTTPINILK